MEAFLNDLDDEKTLRQIRAEVRPEPPRKTRLDSDLVWTALEQHFELEGTGNAQELKRQQGCGADASCMQMIVLQHLDDSC